MKASYGSQAAGRGSPRVTRRFWKHREAVSKYVASAPLPGLGTGALAENIDKLFFSNVSVVTLEGSGGYDVFLIWMTFPSSGGRIGRRSATHPLGHHDVSSSAQTPIPPFGFRSAPRSLFSPLFFSANHPGRRTRPSGRGVATADRSPSTAAPPAAPRRVANPSSEGGRRGGPSARPSNGLRRPTG